VRSSRGQPLQAPRRWGSHHPGWFVRTGRVDPRRRSGVTRAPFFNRSNPRRVSGGASGSAAFRGRGAGVPLAGPAHGFSAAKRSSRSGRSPTPRTRSANSALLTNATAKDLHVRLSEGRPWANARKECVTQPRRILGGGIGRPGYVRAVCDTRSGRAPRLRVLAVVLRSFAVGFECPPCHG